ncbi:DUF6029 family protein [uncultured Flavobacterium sp.]|uniref:DUF6029 family protein n=1 Tax=uncultured Flavobacterium sp. TaxID=165435 RepID=UPI0030CA1919
MNYKYLISIFFISFVVKMHAQEDIKGRFFGGIESNSQYYLDDSELGDFAFENRFRSNNYLNLNYNYGRLSGGILAEGYEKNALLNYNPKLKGTNIGTFYLNYKTNKLDVTAGHIYEQFGSGMILRTWEDRALGINNAIRGARIIYTPSDNIRLTALAGQQRSGFDVSKGKIIAFNSNFNLSKVLKLEFSDVSIGFSYVGRQDEIKIEQPEFDALTNAFSSRLDYSYKSFYASFEHSTKSKDATILFNELENNFVKKGNAFQLNTGYSQKGLGVDLTLRRIENMSFYSEREPDVYPENGGSTSINYNDKILNFVPALTKQHHYNLANIYVHQAQNRIDYIDPTIMKAGETGGQIDVFYTFEKGSKIGGKYGTKVAVNYSSWYNLPGEYKYNPKYYSTNFFGVSQKYFSDFNIEVTKKLNKSLHGNIMYVNQYYDQRLLVGGELVKTNVIAGDVSYKFNTSKSIRIQAEHLWADADLKNWAGATVEFNFNSKLSFYIYDMYNYGNKLKEKQIHYYNLGGSFRKGSSRVALNYGRQRGGLVCVGGVCRFVPESKGISVSLSTSF